MTLIGHYGRDKVSNFRYEILTILPKAEAEIVFLRCFSEFNEHYNRASAECSTLPA